MPAYVKVGGEFAVDENAANNQLGSKVTPFADGRYLMTWIEDLGDQYGPTERVVRAQLYDASGAKLGDAFEVSQTAPGNVASVTAAELADGSFVVTWDLQTDTESGGDGVRSRVFDASGDALGDEFRVNAAWNTTGDPKVAALAGGGFVVTWDANYGARAQLFDSSGAKVGNEIITTFDSYAGYVTSDMVALEGGGFVVTWRSSSSGDSADYDAYARVYDDAGNALGAKFQVNNATTATIYQPSVTALVGGGFVVLWESRATLGDPASTDIRGQRFDAAGNKVGAEFLVNQLTTGNQSGVEATALADGGFLVAWTTGDTTQDGNQTALKARQFGADGLPTGGEFLLNTQAADYQAGVDLATLADGRVLATWMTYGSYGSYYDLRGQFLYTSANAAPQITSDGGGSSASFTIAENQTAVTTVAAADSDGLQPVTYWIGGGADAGLFVIDKVTGALSFAAGPDFESPADANADGVYVVQVEARDGLSVDTQAITVTISNLADGLSFYTTSLSAFENGLAGPTLLAWGGDGAPVAYAIVGGADAEQFAFDAATGELSFVAEPDYEAPADADGDGVYEVEVTADDGTSSVTRTISVALANVNEGQVFLSPEAWTVVEGEQVVGVVVASDIDGDALEYYVLGGPDGGLFAIGPDGTFGFNQAPDFEAPADADGDNVYEIEIIAYDEGDLYTSQWLTIEVTDGEDPVPPALVKTAFETAEVVTFSAAIELSGESVHPYYSIVGGADSWLFRIDSYTGELTQIFGSFDFEAPYDSDGDNVYEIEVEAYDYNSGAEVTETVTIRVRDAVNEELFFVTDDWTSTEGQTFVGTVLGYDAQWDWLTYSISGGADSALFFIDPYSGDLNFWNAPFLDAPVDADGDNVYELELAVTDGYSTEYQTITVTVPDPNDIPSPLFVEDEFSYAENSFDTSLPLELKGGYAGMQITGGADSSWFSIDSSGQLWFFSADFEAPTDADGDNVYEVEITADNSNDPGLPSVTGTVRVTVSDVDEPVTFIGSSSFWSVYENQTVVGTFLAADPETNSVVSYSIAGGADAARFAIDQQTGALSFTAAPDYEAPTDAGGNNVYELHVTATDGVTSGGVLVWVYVTNVADSLAFNSTTFSTPENTTTVGTVQAIGAVGAVTYSIVGGADASRFAINASSGALSFTSAQNYEAPGDVGADRVYDVTVRAVNGTLSTQETIRVSLTNQNEAPYPNSPSTYTVTENTTAVATLQAIDPEGLAVSYSIAGGADASRFQINAATGALSFIAAPDYEAPTDAGGDNAYSVTVRASDGTMSYTQALAIFVRDAAPVITSDGGQYYAQVHVDEGVTTVTTVVASEPEGRPLTYAIAGGWDAALFSIDAATGALRFLAAPNFEAPADYGADNTYQVIVSASTGGATTSQMVLVYVDDGVDVSITTPASHVVAENGTAVATVATVGQAGPVTFAIAGGADAASFTIDGATGALTFVTAPDFEAPADSDGDNVYDVVVSASDGGVPVTQALAVTVTDVDEAPVITSAATVSLDENGTAVAAVSASDPEGGVSYAIAGGADAALFAIDATTGALSFVVAPDFETPGDADGDNLYEVVVNASDGSLSDTQALTVTVDNVDEYARFGSELTVNSTYARSQVHADVTKLANGSFVVVWMDGDFEITTAGRYVRAQVYEADGTAIGGELTLAGPLNGAIQPSVAGLAGGGFVATWSGGTTTVQLFDAAGAPTGAAFTQPYSMLPDIAALPDGGFAMTWRDERPGGPDGSGDSVFLRTYDASGGATSAEVLVNTATLGDQDRPSITALAGGGYVVSWYDPKAGGLQGSWKMQIFDAAGAKVGGEIVVGAGFSDSAPVTALADGSFAVTWYGHEIGGGAEHRIQVFNADGTPAGAVIAVPAQLGGIAETAEIAELSDGNLAIAWLGNWGATNDGSGRGVFVQVFDRSGHAQGDLHQVNTQANGDQFDPSIAALEDGAFVVTWTDLNGAGYDDNEVKAQVFARSDTIVPLAIASNGGGETAALAVAENGADVAVVAASGGFGRIGYVIGGGADAALFAIDAETGALSFASAPDFEAPADADGDNVYEVIVSASDGSLSDTQALSVSVTDVIEYPPFTLAVTAFEVDENTSASSWLQVTGGAGTGTVHYAITGGADASLFSIDELTGELALMPWDFEAPALDQDGDSVYEVEITAGQGADAVTGLVTVELRDVDEAPVFLPPNGFLSLTLAENSLEVATLSAVDPEGHAVSFALLDVLDYELFSIDPQSGALSFLAAPDFEAPAGGPLRSSNVYELGVAVSDGEQVSYGTIEVHVTDVPEILTFAQTAFATWENELAVATLSASGDPATTTYAITGGTDAALFALDAATGALSFLATPDFDAAADADGDNVYEVTVTAVDGTSSGTQSLSITVSDIDEAPVFTSTAAIVASENATAAAAIAANDPEGGVVTYDIVGGADAALFAIDAASGALAFGVAPDFEAPGDANGDNVYEVVIAASSDGLGSAQTVLVTVADVNDAPVIGGGTSAAFELDEGTLAVATVVGSDADAGTALTYTITGGPDAALFAIDASSGALSLIAVPDFEAPTDQAGDNFLTVVVTASDGMLSAWQSISVLVRNVNEGLAITSPASAAVLENATAVMTVSASDIDGDTVGYSIIGGADAARFAIDATTGALSFAAAPNFEAPADADGDNLYEVTVAASDGSFVATQALTVTVGNANEAPVIASPASAVVLENDTAVITVSATDAEGGVSYAIAGGADAALFAIDAATGALSFLAAPDFDVPGDADADNVYDVVVSASDGSLSDTQALAVSVINANELPTIVSGGGGTSFAVDLDEGVSAVTTVVAVDVDADTTLTYSIANVLDGALFAIDAQSGALSFVSAPDFEAPVGTDNFYTVIVTVSDGELATWQSISVLVRNVNEGLAITSPAAASVLENTTAVATVAAVDIDGDTVGYSIAGGADAARFAIDATTGALRFVTAPNFEAPGNADGDNLYQVTVAASDGSLVATQAFTVTVGNVVETPAITSGGGGATAAYAISENATAVAMIAATDPEGPATFTLAGGADAALFAIDAATGALRFIAAPDHDAPADANGDNVYEVAVGASYGNLGDTQALTVTVGNLVDGLTRTGTSKADTLNGGHQEDTINGLAGNDTLGGLAGADTIDGGDGQDRLTGGAGADLLTGGARADTFAYGALSDSTLAASDRIVDFSASQGDRIDLSAIDANAGLGGNQAFSFIGSAAFSNAAGQLRAFQQGGDTLVQGDVNGDGVADFQVIVDPLVTLAAGDFVL